VPNVKKKIPPFVMHGLKEQAVAGKTREPDLAKIVSHWFDVIGGERAFARLLASEFHAAPEGSQVRQRILDMIFRALAKMADAAPAEDDLSVLNEGDIEKELLTMVEVASDGQEEVLAEEPAPVDPLAALEAEVGGVAAAGPGPE
jgi:hypothetical protein